MHSTPSASSIPRSAAGPLLGLALVALTLAGCSDARKSIGLDRSSPDEFSVVSRAPLSMPPDMRSLSPPRPGVARPQEASAAQAAAASVFGGASHGGPPSGKAAVARGIGESALLAKTGPAEPGIRNKVDQETSALIIADKRWIDSLLFWQKQEQPYQVVDPQKESQRLRETQAQGKPINEGAVPTVERRRKGPLEGLF